MPKPRLSFIRLEATSYYRCISRRVGRTFLCGEDALSVPLLRAPSRLNRGAPAGAGSDLCDRDLRLFRYGFTPVVSRMSTGPWPVSGQTLCISAIGPLWRAFLRVEVALSPT